MTAARFDWHGDKWKFFIIAASLSVSSFLTLWFHIVSKTDIYSHFFYVPIIMASFWYQKRGMYVALYLAVIQLLVHYMSGHQEVISENLVRVSMFMLVSFTTATLSEGLSNKQAALKESEAALCERTETIQTIIQASPLAIITTDPQGYVTLWNQAAEAIFGWSADETIGKQNPIVPPDKLDEVRQVRQQILDGGSFVGFETERIHKDGARITVSFSATALQPAETKGILSIIADITERKKSEGFIKSILESVGEGFVVIDPDYRIITANRTYCEQNKILLEDIIGRHCYEISHHTDKPCYEAGERCAPQHTFATGEPCTELHTHYDKEGTPAYIATRSYPMKDQAGKVISIIEIINDITERKKAEVERELLISELDIKNRELEQILYAATHDLKTPLVNINGYCSELKQSIEGIVSLIESKEMSSEIRKDLISLTKELPESFGFVKMSISRMDMLLNGLLQFSRSGRVELKKEDVDMNMLISGISDKLNYRLKDTGASIEVTDLPGCNGDRKQISMVFSNLMENAVKYLDPARKGEIKVTGHKEDDSSVYCVEDNGIGIAVDHQKQIFHIFHQLDPEKGGEGLGLMIVQRIIERHGGKIWLESETGKGGRFFVKLPGAKLTSPPS